MLWIHSVDSFNLQNSSNYSKLSEFQVECFDSCHPVANWKSMSLLNFTVCGQEHVLVYCDLPSE